MEKKTSTPARFKRVAAAFDEVARARICESSGSEHSADDDSTDLSDLIESFMERDDDDEVEGGDHRNEGKKREKVKNGSDSENYWSDSETKEMLQGLLGFDHGLKEVDSDIKRRIRAETELACGFIGSSSSSEEGFKRRLMSRLRDRGLDAGLCKSRWEKTGRFPAGSFEYVDVVVAGTRYIVEVSFAGEFSIARPTNRYLSLLDVFPQIFVGKPDKLKQVVRVMCAASKESLKSNDMHIPPWRRNGYMQAKWFGSYKRTTNSITAKIASNSGRVSDEKRSVGFDTPPAKFYYCRGEFAEGRMKRVVGLNKVGKLAQALNGIEL
ncbi:Protein of unknown function DUF506 [Macleaya cordata]|uniref:DUF506 domain-containing protein n=1 Tax=Macleaya cordata TaxID=56857 RepID=A0A200QI07_MACCD|nr:Protein of unknown function DUF506 [Macleaya cordata]